MQLENTYKNVPFSQAELDTEPNSKQHFSFVGLTIQLLIGA